MKQDSQTSLNDQLRKTFDRWYPGMQTDQKTKIEKKLRSPGFEMLS
jgi:hypothetical protein